MNDTSEVFEQIFRNARQNAIMIMSRDGLVQRVNEAFTTAYGYTREDLQGKHFRLPYIEKDQITLRPEIELNITHREGAATDENTWCTKTALPFG
ncbi:MAG TPA: PAS domain S-box protein [Flavisolibacter sp.]|jgi:PAS domain S-box-containing protein|nr:PAS domain S-box protein [Flavisolibacter sp.]